MKEVLIFTWLLYVQKMDDRKNEFYKILICFMFMVFSYAKQIAQEYSEINI